MAKKVFAVYLAKEGNPNSEAYAKLELPASPWEQWDALDKVRLQTDDILYMEIEDYYAFEHLAPHLDGLEISLNELNDLAELLSALDEVQEVAFDGFLRMEVQNKVNTNGGVITLQELRDLAVSAKTDCYHVVDAADDAALGRFYAENDFIPELDGVSDAVFKMLDFAGKLPFRTQLPNEIAGAGFHLFMERYRWDKPIRAVTIRGIDLVSQKEAEQLSMFVDHQKRDRRIRLEDAVEDIRKRFGKRAISYAVLMGDLKIPDDGRRLVTMPGLMYQ